MSRHPMGRGDDRPRIYVQPTMDGKVAWRQGRDGREHPARTLGEACDAAELASRGQPLVIFWEGRSDG